MNKQTLVERLDSIMRVKDIELRLYQLTLAIVNDNLSQDEIIQANLSILNNSEKDNLDELIVCSHL